ncbi:MAG: DUF4347 domain-containing protein [Cyanobacteria bacterium J069]|nr:MAG: DUF4347 domain-containing protein [Cyanobacteria bacterium J069]
MHSTLTPTLLSAPPRLSLGEDLVVISSELEGYRFLAQRVAPQAEVLLLSQAKDGILAIDHLLSILAPIRRLHLLSPNSGDELHLGSTHLRYNNLHHYDSILYKWRSRLAPKSEILIYDGKLAHTETGQFLIDVLHYLTGAAIAACTMPPRADLPYGHWELDCETPDFSPVVALPPQDLVTLWHGQSSNMLLASNF